MRNRLLPIIVIMATLNTKGEVVSKPVEYKQGDTVLEGLSVYDDAIQGKRPAVLIVHPKNGSRKCWEVAGMTDCIGDVIRFERGYRSP
jgi:hypothetical protein